MNEAPAREPGSTPGEETLPVVQGLFLLMRTTGSHGPAHPLVLETAATLAQDIGRAVPPFALQFVGQAVFRDAVLLPLDLERWQQAGDVARALRNLEAQELVFERMPTADDLRRLGMALARGQAGPSDLLALLRLDGIRWREIRNVGTDESELVDPPVFALTQVTLALAEAGRLPTSPGQPWPWVAGVSIVRRLERAAATDRHAALRAMDLAPGAWDVPRRAASATLDALLVLRALGVTESTVRATAHATLALGIGGYGARGGLPVAAAAGRALPGLLGSPVTSRAGVEPHRLRTTALVHAIARPRPAGTPRVAALVDLCYELARARCPEAVPFDLGHVDVMAMAARQAGRRFDGEWVSALVSACGVVPPGAFVRLADGRTGTVVEPGPDEDPWRPQVMVDGSLVVPAEPVDLVSPAAARAGG